MLRAHESSGFRVFSSEILAAEVDVMLIMPAEAGDARRSRQDIMDDPAGFGANTSLSSTKERSQPTPVAFQPTNPGSLLCVTGGSVPDNKAVGNSGDSKIQIPAKILLPRRISDFKIHRLQFIYQPSGEIVSKATRIDEVDLRLRRIEGGALERDGPFNQGLIA